jgi:hypothetical protein
LRNERGTSSGRSNRSGAKLWSRYKCQSITTGCASVFWSPFLI